MEGLYDKELSIRLAGVLQMRKCQRDLLVQSMARLESSIQSIDDRLKAIWDDRLKLQESIRLQGAGRLSIEHLLDRHRYEIHLDHKEESLRSQKSELIDNVNQQRVELMVADIELKRLEKLLDRAQKKSKDWAAVCEQRTLDDRVAARFWQRNRSEEGQIL